MQVGPDGARAPASIGLFWDTQLQIYCAPSLKPSACHPLAPDQDAFLSDGGYVPRAYSDSACTLPVRRSTVAASVGSPSAELVAAGLPPLEVKYVEVYQVSDAGQWSYGYLPAAAYTGDIYSWDPYRDGGCSFAGTVVGGPSYLHYVRATTTQAETALAPMPLVRE